MLRQYRQAVAACDASQSTIARMCGLSPNTVAAVADVNANATIFSIECVVSAVMELSPPRGKTCKGCVFYARKTCTVPIPNEYAPNGCGLRYETTT